MTRRDYILIADVCKQFELPFSFLLELANQLAKQNPRFDGEMFLRNAVNTDDNEEV